MARNNMEMPEVSNRDILNSLMAIVARIPPVSLGGHVMREIQYLPEFEGDSKTLTHFIVMVENHLANTGGDQQTTWTIIQQTKVKGRAMDLLMVNGVTTWDQAKELFRQHYRPIISSTDLTREILNMKVSSIYDLVNKLEYLLSKINTYVIFSDNQEPEKLLLHNIIINKLRDITVGNLARELRDKYGMQDIKKILFSYIGYDHGNLKTIENKDSPNQYQSRQQNRVHNEQRTGGNYRNSGNFRE